MLGRIINILIKEFIQLWRDKWARFRLIVPAVIQLLLFGYAATFEVYHVSTAVLDLDRTQESRELIAPVHVQQSVYDRQARAIPARNRCHDRPQ